MKHTFYLFSLSILFSACGNSGNDESKTKTDSATSAKDYVIPVDWADYIANATGLVADSLYHLEKEDISGMMVYRTDDRYTMLGMGVSFEANGDLMAYDLNAKNNNYWIKCGNWSFEKDIITLSYNNQEKKLAAYSLDEAGQFWVLMDTVSREVSYYDKQIGD